MPLFVPVLIGAAVIGASGFGLKKGYDGVSNLSRANGVVSNAQDRHKRALRSLDCARLQTNGRAADYSRTKVAALQGPIAQFLDVMDRLRLKTRLNDVDAIASIDLAPEEVAEYRTALVEVKELGPGAFTATAAGAAASQGTLSLVGSYGVASTGTAIAGLSGAAANSAMLAWLGGGSLAAGGWGMAGGTVVLGGIAVAPLMAIGGMTLAVQAEKALTHAMQYQAEVNASIGETHRLEAFLKQLRRRFDELERLVQQLGCRTSAAVGRIPLETFDRGNDSHVAAFQQAAALCKALGEVLRAPVLDADGNLSPESARLHIRYTRLYAEAA